MDSAYHRGNRKRPPRRLRRPIKENKISYQGNKQKQNKGKCQGGQFHLQPLNHNLTPSFHFLSQAAFSAFVVFNKEAVFITCTSGIIRKNSGQKAIFSIGGISALPGGKKT